MYLLSEADLIIPISGNLLSFAIDKLLLKTFSIFRNDYYDKIGEIYMQQTYLAADLFHYQYRRTVAKFIAAYQQDMI